MQADTPHEALVAQAVAGDNNALGALLMEHHARLREALVAEIGPALTAHYSADDAVQETWAYVFERMAEFEPRGEGSFFAWLKTVGRRKVQDAARAVQADKRGGGRQRVHVTDEQATNLAQSLGAFKPDTTTPSRAAARGELTAQVRVALARLNENERQVLTLRFFEHLEWDEIAARMENTKSSVRAIGHRAVDKMEEYLGSMSKYLTRV